MLILTPVADVARAGECPLFHVCDIRDPRLTAQNYSGDYGDFASFATHMRRLAEDKGVDMLLV